MSDKLLTKQDLQKRVKIDAEKLRFFIDQKIITDKEIYTEEDLSKIKEYRKAFPFSMADAKKRYKITSELIDKFKITGLIEGTCYFSSSDFDLFQSWQKLKRLGYSDEACFTVLNQVGVPREENLFEDSSLIQLKDLSDITEIPERTIKFYEKEGLIPKPRIYKNKRFYDRQIGETLLLIRDMQKIGYKLSTIAEFLKSLSRDKAETIHRINTELNKKIKIINSIIDRVEAI